MSCRVNKTVETKDSYLNHLPIVENENKNQLSTCDEHIVESKTVSVNTNNNKKRQERFPSFKFCRNSKNVEVVNQNMSPVDCGHTSLKDTDEHATDDISNEVISSTLISEAVTRKPENLEDEKSSVYQGGKHNVVKAPRRINRSEVSMKYQNAVHENAEVKSEDEKRNTSNYKKHRKKNTEEDIQLVYKNQLASLSTAAPETYTNGVAMIESQPTVEEESDLIVNAEEERKQNKQRVRTKKMKENGHLSPAKVMNKLDMAYQNAQSEIDRILKPQDKDVDLERKKGKAKKKKGFVEMNIADFKDEASSSDEKESLEKTRQKMHKLLDDAFSVISQRKSVINKEDPSKQSSHEINVPSFQGSSTRTEQAVQTNVSMNKEKIHTPIEVLPSLKFRDQTNLTTWSPYRAYDDSMLISLSKAEGNLNTTPAQQESITTTIFEQPFSTHSTFYATEPGEPILIKTKNLDMNLQTKESKSELSIRKHFHPSVCLERPPFSVASKKQINLQNFIYGSGLSSKIVSVCPDSCCGCSYFHESPTTTSLSVQTAEKKKNDKASDIDETRIEDIVRSVSIQEGGNTMSISGDSKNYDIVDVIKQSLQPGVSPQPLINSLRKELQTLSRKKLAKYN